MGGRCKEEKEVRDEAADFSFFFKLAVPGLFYVYFQSVLNRQHEFLQQECQSSLGAGF